MATVSLDFWRTNQSTVLTDKKLPALRIDVTSDSEHTVREKNAAIHGIAANLELASKGTDHWTIVTDQFGVQVNLVSRAPEEFERAVLAVNNALDECKYLRIL